MIEIITVNLEGIKNGMKCSIIFNQPSRTAEWVVIGRTAWTPSS